MARKPTRKPWATEPAEATAETVRNTALGLLARREHTALELSHKLRARDLPESLVAPVLQSLVDEGLLSDARFAEIYAASRLDKGYGPLRIRQELRQRGVDEELIAATLAELDDLWEPRLAALQRRRFDGAPADRDQQARQTRFLRQRGFTLEQINLLFRQP